MKRLLKLPGVGFLKEMGEIYFEKQVGRSAAELAYFLILSLFPALICVNAFIGALEVDGNSLLRALQPFVPPGLLAVVSEYLTYITLRDSPGLLAAGAMMTLFSASAAMRGLMNIMDDIYERRGYRGVRQVLASVIFSVLLLAAIYLSIVVVVTGNWFFHLLARFMPFRLLELYQGTWQGWKFLLLFGVVFVLVLLIYVMAAPPGRPRAPVLTGAALAAGALVLASMIFSVFIGMSSRYSLVYGSLTSVIILLVWLYLCGNVLILGNVFNCVWYRRKIAKKVSKKP